MHFICPETGIEDCILCTGEACDYCGAGCWNNNPNRNCQHDVCTRHMPNLNDKLNFMELPSDDPAWREGP
jgi:hypothetical protein